MEKKELVINLNFTTGYELSFMEVLNYQNTKNIKTNRDYLQTHCLEFLEDKYKDMFKFINVNYDGNKTLSPLVYQDLKETTYKLIETLKNTVYLPKINKLENELLNGLHARLNNHLLNIDFLNKVIEELNSYVDDAKDIKIFTNYLKLIDFAPKYCDIDGTTKHGAINFNFFNIEQDDQNLWVSMFIHTHVGMCQVFKNRREVFDNDKTYLFVKNNEEVDYYIRLVVKAVNKVVFGNTAELMIVEK